jgi:hypothetical protein
MNAKINTGRTIVKLNWFYELNSLWIVIFLMAVMFLAAEIGYRVGRWRRAGADDSGKGRFGAVQGSLLGLLALLLAFTFNMSAQRYETRRQLMIDDAASLSSIYQWCRLLPEPQRPEFKELLRQYIDLRTDVSHLQHGLTTEEVARRVVRAEDLHRRMWDLAGKLAQGDPPVKAAENLLPLLNNVLSIQQRRVYAYESRVPGTVIGLLFGAAVTAIVAVGFSGGLSHHRGMLARFMMIILVCGTIYVILDLEQPRRGLIQVSQAPLVRVKQIIEHDPEIIRPSQNN